MVVSPGAKTWDKEGGAAITRAQQNAHRKGAGERFGESKKKGIAVETKAFAQVVTCSLREDQYVVAKDSARHGGEAKCQWWEQV